MAKAIPKLKKVRIGAFQSKPLANKEPNPVGIVQGIATYAGVTDRIIWPKKVVITKMGAVKTKGMKYVGFRVIGYPNTTGSLIWNTPGARENLATSFSAVFLLKINVDRIRAKVEPAPPKKT